MPRVRKAPSRGTAIRCTVDYDLFGTNIKDEEGCLVKYDKNTEKYLIWFSCNGEWAELKENQFELPTSRDHVPSRYKDFVDRIETLKYSH